MLTLVEIRNVAGDLMSLPLDDVSDGLVLEDVGGLGPVKATIVSSSFAGLDDEQFHSAKREKRNVTFKLGLEPDYVTTSVRDLRQRLYKYFMPKAIVSMRFYDSDDQPVEISGYVESCDPDIFSREPKMDISVICLKSDFLALTPITVEGDTTSGTDEVLIEYNGSVEAGINLKLLVDRTVSELTIYHRPPDGTVRTTDFAWSMLTGDVLEMNTVRGNKYVVLTRTGTQSSVLNGQTPQSNWVELQPGENYIRVYAEGAAIPWEITYTERYGGL